MAVTTNTMVYIGTLGSIDLDESDYDAEFASDLAGVYTAFQDLELVDLVSQDINDDSAISDDDVFGTTDHVQYSRGGSAYDETVDSTVTFTAQVIDVNGSVYNIDVVVVQMQNGDTFVGDMQNLGNMDNLTIRSIELISPITTDAAGYNTWQSMSGSTVCFWPATAIATPTGFVRVEHLAIGDTVLLAGGGIASVRLIIRSAAPRSGRAAPISFAPGSLGQARPFTTLRLSPQHRLLVKNKMVQRLCKQPAALIPAKRFCSLPGISRAPAWWPAQYYHLVLDRHAVILANGALCESFYPGTQALANLPFETKRSIQDIYPDPPDLAGPVPSARDQHKIIDWISRHSNKTQLCKLRLAPLR